MQTVRDGKHLCMLCDGGKQGNPEWGWHSGPYVTAPFISGSSSL